MLSGIEVVEMFADFQQELLDCNQRSMQEQTEALANLLAGVSQIQQAEGLVPLPDKAIPLVLAYSVETQKILFTHWILCYHVWAKAFQPL